MKKLLLLLVLFILHLGYLEIWGGRDFAQVGLAIEKYNYSDDLEIFGRDMSSIYFGETINSHGLATAQMADRVYYRWIDNNGVQQHSERRPNIEQYDTIRMGNLSIDVQKSLSKEEIDKILKR